MSRLSGVLLCGVLGIVLLYVPFHFVDGPGPGEGPMGTGQSGEDGHRTSLGPMTDEDIIARWYLDEGTGTVVRDSSGNANDGTIKNGAKWTDGLINKALSFDGVNDWVDCGNDASYTVSNYTLSAWVNMSANQTTAVYGSWVAGKEFNQLGFGLAVEGRKPLIIHSDGTNFHLVRSDNDISLGEWHHLVASYDGTTVKLYVDGAVEVSEQHGFKNALVHFSIGSWIGGGPPSRSFVGKIDEVTLYDVTLSSQQIRDLFYNITDRKPPVWGAVPVLDAVEDVPITYDFTQNVSDPDTPMTGLSLHSPSLYISYINGFNVTFLFPNGVLEAEVPIFVTDGANHIRTTVQCLVEPVNDPPEQNVRESWSATEDIYLEIDLRNDVWDVDNDKDELAIILESPYVEVDGWRLYALFPEGVLEYDLWFNVSDGQLLTEVHLHFSISPVDDPPTISELGVFNAREGEDSVFDLRPFLSDSDTPLDDLAVLVRDPDCTVQGLELHFLYDVGGVSENVTIEVADTRTRVSAVLTVQVENVNDAPVVQGRTHQTVVEGEETLIDLSLNVFDEDNVMEELNLACDDPHVIEVKGMTLTMLYPDWEEDHTVEFVVTDGLASATGVMDVHVVPVNDPPVIEGVGDLEGPGTITVDEGTTSWFHIAVHDVDSDEFHFALSSNWSGVDVLFNGTLVVTAAKDEVGSYDAHLSVGDGDGGTAVLNLTVRVVNVNDPPSAMTGMRPVNHTVYEEGDGITFMVSVDDPDMKYGQVLTVTWRSNVSGTLRELTSGNPLEFEVDDLQVGVHRITVTVTDGEFQRERWYEIEVRATDVPPPEPTQDDGEKSSPESGSDFTWAVIVIVVVVCIPLVGLSVWISRRRGSV